MPKISKRFKNASEQVDALKLYPLEEAIDILSKFDPAKFDETVEISATLGVDPKQSNQMVRGTVTLPHGSGKKVRVVAFTEKADEAIKAGADEAGVEELIEKIKDGWLDFDVAVATPAAMAKVKPIARVLGPRGLMPNPKTGTVTDDIESAINAVKAGRVEFKMDKSANVAIVVGKRSFNKEQLLGNVQEAIDVLVKSRPEVFKGKFIKTISISSSMSPGVKIASSDFGGKAA